MNVLKYNMNDVLISLFISLFIDINICWLFLIFVFIFEIIKNFIFYECRIRRVILILHILILDEPKQ